MDEARLGVLSESKTPLAALEVSYSLYPEKRTFGYTLVRKRSVRD